MDASARFHVPRSAGCEANRGASTFYSRHGKRTFDFIASLVGLIMLAIPMAVSTILIWAFDGRPVFFRQKRVGRHGKLFTIYKFRTMKDGGISGTTISAVSDSRVTPLGYWLRRFKLDELPQLWNVLRGDMSFVGPRPDVPGYLDRLSGEAKALWELRPGITGPATLLFRREEKILSYAKDYIRFNDEVIYPEKVRINLAYIHKRSFLLDLGYILATIAPSRGARADGWLGIDAGTFESRMRHAAQQYSL